MKKVKIRCTGGPYGDCCSSYHLDIYEPITVGELWNEYISKLKERGTIVIGGEKAHRIEYRCGQITSGKEIYNSFKDTRISNCNAHGGWGLMDYMIQV